MHDSLVLASPTHVPEICTSRVHDPLRITEIKKIADAHRWEIGFHARQAFEESAKRSELIVATRASRAIGFVRYHHRRDHKTTVYEIVTTPEFRGKGIGRLLLEELKAECRRVESRSIRLACPVELGANQFYAAAGFRQIGARSKPGKSRPLYEWELTLTPDRPLVFVASLTASGYDLTQMIRLWETHGKGQPFQRCIITPLFTRPGAFEHIRYMQERWGVEVMFDSGGFFVQQAKIRYEELFAGLMDFYVRNSWADIYVLPDFVPTSRNTPAEVDERVYVTAAEGLKFLKRLPSDLRSRALGVLQGHEPEHLGHCFAEFAGNGLRWLGFGSFDTQGVNAEINILTQDAAGRLGFVRELIRNHFSSRGVAMDLHLFGVSSPAVIRSFRGYGATSFDSSGWLRTAGFGNVYLPFRTRRNVSHGAAGVSVGSGMRASEFYAECERTMHACPFCADFSLLQRDRFFRMWHNAIVFREMTEALNRPMRSERADTEGG